MKDNRKNIVARTSALPTIPETCIHSKLHETLFNRKNAHVHDLTLSFNSRAFWRVLLQSNWCASLFKHSESNNSYDTVSYTRENSNKTIEAYPLIGYMDAQDSYMTYEFKNYREIGLKLSCQSSCLNPHSPSSFSLAIIALIRLKYTVYTEHSSLFIRSTTSFHPNRWWPLSKSPFALF